MKSLEDLKKIREEMQQKINIRTGDENRTRVVVGMATCGIAAGARPVLAALVDEVSRRKLQQVTVTQTGCIGVCRLEPIIEVLEPGKEKVTYVKVTEEKVKKIVSEHLANGRVVEEYTIGAAE
ncbi:MAG: (2Fe-2S) ferredoxin domain-containing protein [Peptococcaceae bacterium]|nr:(2Fe-2S) ferredoxin domain-containing protein [Peptococcaceae bacterium]